MIYVKYITDKANEINKERKEKGYTKADFKETPESKILLENFKNAIEWYEFKDSDKAKEFYKENDRAIAYMKQNNIKIIGEGKERYKEGARCRTGRNQEISTRYFCREH